MNETLTEYVVKIVYDDGRTVWSKPFISKEAALAYLNTERAKPHVISCNLTTNKRSSS